MPSWQHNVYHRRKARADLSLYKAYMGQTGTAFALPGTIDLFVRYVSAIVVNTLALTTNFPHARYAKPGPAGHVHWLGRFAAGTLVEVQAGFELCVDAGLGKYVQIGGTGGVVPPVLTLEAISGTQHLDSDESNPAYDNVGFANIAGAVGYTPFGTGYSGPREWAALNNNTDFVTEVVQNAIIRLNTDTDAFKTLKATIGGQEFTFDVFDDRGEGALFASIPQPTLPFVDGETIKLEFFNAMRTQDTELEFVISAATSALASGDTGTGYDVDGKYSGAATGYGTLVSGPADKLRAIFTDKTAGVTQYNTFMVWSTAFSIMDSADIIINGGAPETVAVSVDEGNSFYAFDFTSEIADGDTVSIRIYKA